jgi:hypothetical protein
MAASDWAPAFGALGGAVVGALTAVAIQGRVWRREQGTRWDRDTINAYASFLQRASATFDCALLIASPPAGSAQKILKSFGEQYGKTASVYEELVLFDITARNDAQRLIWILWNFGKQTIPEATDLHKVTHAYRDARFHIRRHAQLRLRISTRTTDIPSSDECDEAVHSSPLGRAPSASAWDYDSPPP